VGEGEGSCRCPEKKSLRREDLHRGKRTVRTEAEGEGCAIGISCHGRQGKNLDAGREGQKLKKNVPKYLFIHSQNAAQKKENENSNVTIERSRDLNAEAKKIKRGREKSLPVDPERRGRKLSPVSDGGERSPGASHRSSTKPSKGDGEGEGRKDQR